MPGARCPVTAAMTLFRAHLVGTQGERIVKTRGVGMMRTDKNGVGSCLKWATEEKMIARALLLDLIGVIIGADKDPVEVAPAGFDRDPHVLDCIDLKLELVLLASLDRL